MLKNMIYSSIILIIFLIACFIIYDKENSNEIKYNNIETIYIKNNNTISKKNEIVNNKTDEVIGKLIINKINIMNDLYNIESKKNNVEENVTILKGSIEPENDNSIMFLAAHSGTGNLAYFKNLNQLEIDDEIILIYKNISYDYRVESIWESEKDGNIEVPKLEKKQLILTTCSPNKNNKQLIINCTIKEP